MWMWALAVMCGTVGATAVNSYDVQFPPATKPPPFKQQTFGDVTFTRDGATAPAGPGKIKLVGQVSFTNVQYPLDLANVAGNGKRFTSVDSLFQICYGGGYVSPLVAASGAGVGPANYTIAAGTAWYQTCRNNDNFFGAGAGKNNNLLNFTNSWRQDVQNAPLGGMLAHFDAATTNSPYTPPQPAANVPDKVNYSIYASPDPAVGPALNDTRTLGDENLGMANQQRQFVILAAWSLPNYRRYAVNTLRMYDLITRDLGVPANQVAILYGNPQNGPLGTFPGPINGDPNGLLPPAVAGGPLRQAPVNGPNTRQGWLDALSGKSFLDAAGKPLTPQPGDKLFIYNTGHGALDTKFKGTIAATGNQEDYALTLDDKYNLHTSGNLAEDLTLADIAPDGTSLQQNLQLSFGQRLPSGTHLSINGQDAGPLDSAYLSDPSQVLPIAPFVTAPTYSYGLTVSESILSDPDHIDFRLTGPSPDLSLASLAAIDISGGDQELLVEVPEPCQAAMVIVAAGVLLRCRVPRPRTIRG